MGIKEGSVAAVDVKYLVNQMGCHESRIDDNDRDLHEIMGTIDNTKEEVQMLTIMNQCIHCQESPTKYHPMEQTSVAQPFNELGEKKK